MFLSLQACIQLYVMKIRDEEECTLQTLQSVRNDDVRELSKSDTNGTRDLSLRQICKIAASEGKLKCLKWAFLRCEVSKNELMPLTTGHKHCRDWLIAH